MDCCEDLCHSSVIRNHIVEKKVMEELLHRATNYVDATSRKKTCQMLCTIANADEAASQMVLELVNKQIRLCINHVIDLQPSYRTGPCSVPELVSPIRRLMSLVASMFGKTYPCFEKLHKKDIDKKFYKSFIVQTSGKY